MSLKNNWTKQRRRGAGVFTFIQNLRFPKTKNKYNG